MTDLMDKVRIGLFVTALAGVGIAGFGATGRLRASRAREPDLEVTDRAFCRHRGASGSVSGYCSSCGSGRQVSSTVFRRCTRCGRNASDDSLFCTSCRWKLSAK